MDYRSLRDSLAEYKADYRSQLTDLQDLISRCQEGIETETNTARGDIVKITQKRPEIEMQARRLLWDILKTIDDKAEAAIVNPEGTQRPALNIQIVPAVPKEP